MDQGQMRRLAGAALLLASWLLVTVNGAAAGSHEGVQEHTLRQVIASWSLLTPQERNVLLPWLFTAIGQQPDAHIRGSLTQELDLQRSRLPAEPPQEVLAPEEAIQIVQARQSLEHLLKQRRKGRLSEQEIRERIEGLTLDPAQPEIGLAHGMELAGAIDQIEDHTTRETLRRILEGRLVRLQEGLPEM